jgi:hypothetical protein
MPREVPDVGKKRTVEVTEGAKTYGLNLALFKSTHARKARRQKTSES